MSSLTIVAVWLRMRISTSVKYVLASFGKLSMVGSCMERQSWMATESASSSALSP